MSIEKPEKGKIIPISRSYEINFEKLPAEIQEDVKNLKDRLLVLQERLNNIKDSEERSTIINEISQTEHALRQLLLS